MRVTTNKKARAGWHWTRRGWQRSKPRRRSLGKEPPPKRQFRRQVVVTPPPEREKPAYGWRAPTLAQERLAQPVATQDPAKPEKRTTRPPRAAWHGKYDQLGAPPPPPTDPTP